MLLKIMVSCGLPFMILSLLTTLGFVLAGIRNKQMEKYDGPNQ